MRQLILTLILISGLSASALAEIKQLNVHVDGHSDVLIPFSRASKTIVPEVQSSLTEGEIEILNSKRNEVFEAVLDRYIDQIGFSEEIVAKGRARGIGLVIRFLQRLDFEMLSHAKQMISCNQWGVCSSIMVQGGGGFMRAFAAIGANISWDSTTRFGTDEWEKSKYFDLEFGRNATTPAILILAGYKFVVHFDLKKDETFTEFDTTYRMTSPIRIEGNQTFGAGNRIVLNLPTLALASTGLPFALGLIGLPINAGMSYRTKVFRQRYDNVVKRVCDSLLQAKAAFGGGPGEPLIDSRLRANAVPDDIQ